MSKVVDTHYHHAVDVYDDSSLFFLQPQYEEWVMNCLIKMFDFDAYPIRMVDLGCGNGRFTNKFIERIKPTYQIESCIGVDPYMEWLSVTQSQCNITETMCLNANAFSDIPPEKIGYSHLLMKEMVHHIDRATLPKVFRGIYDQLDANGCGIRSIAEDNHAYSDELLRRSSEYGCGSVVVITRPVDTNYPFFERIHHLWKSTQTPYEDIVVSMKTAGFQVSVVMATLPVTVQKPEWLSFIKNKTWSVFSMCSDQEMEDGLSTLQAELEDRITFNETLVFVVGSK